MSELSLDEQRQAIASWMPPGMAWAAFRLANTNAYNFLLGLASEFVRMAAFIAAARVTIPNSTNNDDFIAEWEEAVGIPDSCLLGTGTLEERWRHVLVKFAGANIQTANDFVALAGIFGFTITVQGGMDFRPDFGSDKEARNTIVVTFATTEVEVFPYTFPFTFEESQSLIIECLLTTLKPVTSNIDFRHV